jgi:hypothetical protein
MSEVHPAALYRHRHDSAFACQLEDEPHICGNLLHVQFLCTMLLHHPNKIELLV